MENINHLKHLSDDEFFKNYNYKESNDEKKYKQIFFNKNESLITTLRNNADNIMNSTYSSYHIQELYELLKKPYPLNYYLESSVRHQGTIHNRTYYWSIFIIEMLTRENDAICNQSTKIPLKCQLYYESYILQPLIDYYNDYCDISSIELVINFMSRQLEYDNNYNSDSHIQIYKKEYMDDLNNTDKFIQLVKEHICRIKENLIDKCKKEEITPVRALWLFLVPLSYLEMEEMLNLINNKYIRSSLFWIAGFQKILLINNLAKTNLENTAFKMGLNLIEKYEKRKLRRKYYKHYKLYKITEFKLNGIKKFNSYVLPALISSYDCYYCANGFGRNYCMKIDGACSECIILNKKKLTKKNYKRWRFKEKVRNTNYIPTREEIKEYFKKNKIEYFSYYPFYYSHYYLNNYLIGYSKPMKDYMNHFDKIALDYRKYYNNHNYKSHNFLSENEDSKIIESEYSMLIKDKNDILLSI